MTDLTKLVRKLEWNRHADGADRALDGFGGVFTVQGDDWTHTDMAGWLGGGKPMAEGNHAARVVAALDAELLAEVVGALDQMIYETTSLSPEEADGSHWCRISKTALTRARAIRAKLGAV